MSLEKFFSDIYNDINNLFGEDLDLSFMNHGFFPINDILKNQNIFFKNRASLYLLIFEYLKHKNDFKIDSFLEIGCGRGGGINILKETIITNLNQPNIKFKAIDINEKNINFCKHNFSGINFELANGEDLSINENIDVIINVESSHCYQNHYKFFKTISNLLNSNGLFFYCDIFSTKNVLYEEILNEIFNIDLNVDITKNVMESLAYTEGLLSSSTKPEFIKDHILKNMSYQYNLYKQGINVFKFYVLSKKIIK